MDLELVCKAERLKPKTPKSPCLENNESCIIGPTKRINGKLKEELGFLRKAVEQSDR